MSFILIFLCFGSEITISLPLFPNIFCYFLWIISWSCFNFIEKRSVQGERLITTIIFFPVAISAINSKTENCKNLCCTSVTFSSKLKSNSGIFLTYKVTGSLKSDQQTVGIPSLGRHHSLPHVEEKEPLLFSVPSAEKECISYVLAPLMEKGAYLLPPPPIPWTGLFKAGLR